MNTCEDPGDEDDAKKLEPAKVEGVLIFKSWYAMVKGLFKK